MSQKTQYLDIDIKAASFEVDTEAYTVSGYLAIFNTEDLGGDVLLPDALKSIPKSMPMLWHHRQEEPIGVWDNITVDTKGIHVEGRLAKGVQKAEEVLKLFNIGAVKGLSMGYRTHEASYESSTGIRYLKSISLHEGSWTPIPMHPDARIESAKSLDTERKSQFEAILQELRQITVR